jgi:pyrrolysyl-tRNA synthetase-like protein
VAEIGYTPAQRQRLTELGADPAELEKWFDSEEARDAEFKISSRNLTRKGIKNIKDYLSNRKKPIERIIEEKLRSTAISLGFSEVTTPIIISRSFIESMGIKRGDPLWKQIIWLDERQALRPMLAPSLYTMMGKLLDYDRPVKIFEIGQCFRLDTKGPMHLQEFTMLNMVELAPQGEDLIRLLLGHIDAMMKPLGLDYETTSECSEVYGSTIDVRVKGLEVASAAIGPNPIDPNWGIRDPWIGVGFGLERLAMLVGGYTSVGRVGRSLVYLDGSKLSVR